MWKQSYTEDEVEYVHCPLCGGSDSRDVAEEWSLIISTCARCEMAYVRRRIMHSEWNYRGDKEGLLLKYGPYIREEKTHDRERNYQQILGKIDTFRGNDSRLLDVGPYLGWFMRAASRRGWQVVGVEQSPVAAELACTHMKLDVRTGYLDEFGFKSEFDVVTFLDVLEHIANPVETLSYARRAVRPGGVVLAKVPSGAWNNLKYRTVKKILGDRIDSFDCREHILQFTARTLKDAFRRADLKPLELFVPYPVQTGGSIRRSLRWSAYAVGSSILAWSGTDNALCPDICLIGVRPT